MNIIHRYSLNSKRNFTFLEELAKKGVAVKFGAIISTFEISESDSCFSEIYERSKQTDPVHLIATTFTKAENSRASFLKLSAVRIVGYPQPEDDFGYLNKTYDLTTYCSSCGIGQIQNAPFRIKESFWSDKFDFLQLNWVFDVFFVRLETYESIFKPFGIPSFPVLNAEGTQKLDRMVQLHTQDVSVPNLRLENHPLVRCERCQTDKYLPHSRGFFPSFTSDCGGHFIQSREWFGTGHESRKQILVSQALYKAISGAKLKGVNFVPQG